MGSDPVLVPRSLGDVVEGARPGLVSGNSRWRKGTQGGGRVTREQGWHARRAGDCLFLVPPTAEDGEVRVG